MKTMIKVHLMSWNRSKPICGNNNSVLFSTRTNFVTCGSCKKIIDILSHTETKCRKKQQFKRKKFIPAILEVLV